MPARAAKPPYRNTKITKDTKSTKTQQQPVTHGQLGLFVSLVSLVSLVFESSGASAPLGFQDCPAPARPLHHPLCGGWSPSRRFAGEVKRRRR